MCGTRFSTGTSWGSFGILLPIAGDIMNFVVLTAALSSLNAGLYSTGRILRSMSMNGSAPQLLSRMSSNGVPFAGIALTACFTVVGVFMNMVIPAKAFETALDVAALGIIASWATIVICQLRLYQWTQRGILQRGKFQMPGAPYTGYATLIFLLVVLVLMCYENYWNLVALGIFTPLLIIGWYLSKERVMQLARERVGYTGQYPVIAETPMMDDPPNLGDK